MRNRCVADLIAQGTQIDFRWRRSLPPGETIALGRAAGPFSANWDEQISRRHAELCFREDTLYVQQLPDARNPIFVAGQTQRVFELAVGEHFVIGQTTFTLVDQPVNLTVQAPVPARQQTFSPQYLQQVQFRNARARIEVLGRLPDVISGATSDDELFVRLTNLLLSGIPTADTVALVRLVADASGVDQVEVLHWDRRQLHRGEFTPSQRLIRQAIEQGESVLHLWNREADSQFTARDDIDWAFCTPIAGDACYHWGIFVSGRTSSLPDGSSPSSEAADFRDDLKFTEVAAATLKSLQELRALQRRHAGLRHFFSPRVLETLSTEDPDIALVPRETEVCVMFCDLRGFSLESERSADDLMGLLDRVSQALGVTTHQILEQGGVVGDFQGDAVMGFWGWPIAQPDAIARAAAAALAIRTELTRAANRQDNALAGFALGIGIAAGNAVAGKIGTVDQAKVTVFGPVVNLASRLEGMTRLLRAPILLDETSADHLRQQVSEHQARVRRLAVVKPYGMQSPVSVSELLPAESAELTLTNDQVAEYEHALEAFQQGDWEEAWKRLHRVPAEDYAKDFLTVTIAQHNRRAPADWQGVIALQSK